jgi:archaemetzincin
MPPNQRPDKLCIVSLGETPLGVEKRALSAVQSRFGLVCEILSPEPRPAFALDTLRDQHDCFKILDWLEERFPFLEKWILAITNVDLSIPVLTFVFGEARLGGRSAVISTFRLREEFYGYPSDDMVLLSRVEKEAIHEVGHMLGLTHCLDRNCVMYPSNTLLHTDVKSTKLCPRCHCCLPQWCQARPPGPDPSDV